MRGRGPRPADASACIRAAAACGESVWRVRAVPCSALPARCAGTVLNGARACLLSVACRWWQRRSQALLRELLVGW